MCCSRKTTRTPTFANFWKRLAALQSNLPEVLVQRQNQPGLGFRAFQQGGICVARTIGSRPEHVVAGSPHDIDSREREVLVGED
jgi:hypothetical protein